VNDGGQSDWDYFVSYAQADREWAEWIAYELEGTGARVLVQAWDSVPGTNWPELVQRGITAAAVLIPILSVCYTTSAGGAAEWQAVWAADIAGRQRRIVPVLIADPADLNLGLAGTRTWIDLRGLSGAEDRPTARARLLDGLSAARNGRAKPAGPIGFPGAAVPKRHAGGATLVRADRKSPMVKALSSVLLVVMIGLMVAIPTLRHQPATNRPKIKVVALRVQSGRDTADPHDIEIVTHNTGTQRTVITRATLTVRGYLYVPVCASQGGGVPLSATYGVVLPANPSTGHVIGVDLNQQMGADEADRFAINFRSITTSPERGTDFYVLHVALEHDGASEPVDAGDVIVAVPALPAAGQAQYWSRSQPVSAESFAFLGTAQARAAETCMTDNTNALRKLLARPTVHSSELDALKADLGTEEK